MNFHDTVKRTNRITVFFFFQLEPARSTFAVAFEEQLAVARASKSLDRPELEGVMYVCKYITQGHDVPYAISLCILYPKIICLSYFFFLQILTHQTSILYGMYKIITIQMLKLNVYIHTNIRKSLLCYYNGKVWARL